MKTGIVRKKIKICVSVKLISPVRNPLSQMSIVPFVTTLTHNFDESDYATLENLSRNSNSAGGESR